MTQRITIGLLDSAELDIISQRLHALGVEILSMPTASLPNVIVATIPTDYAIEEYLAKIKKIPEVSYAEADAWGMTC